VVLGRLKSRSPSSRPSLQRLQNTTFLDFKVAKVSDAVIKSFEVPKSFLNNLRSSSLLESEASAFPTRPFLVDATEAYRSGNRGGGCTVSGARSRKRSGSRMTRIMSKT